VLELGSEGLRIWRFFGADQPQEALAAKRQMSAQGDDASEIPYIVRDEVLAWRDIEDCLLDSAAGSLVLPFTRRKMLANLMIERRAEFYFEPDAARAASEIAERIRGALGPKTEEHPASVGEALGPLTSRVRQAAGRLGKMLSGHESAATPPAGAGPDLDLLERLAALHERGILTDEEFEAKKKQILGL